LESSILETEDPLSVGVLTTSFVSTTFVFYAGIILLLILLLLLSALLSGSEASFFLPATESILKNKKHPTPTERLLLKLWEQPKYFLATILIFNYFVNISIVIIAAFLTLHIAGPEALTGISLILFVILITFIIVFFGEIIPKLYSNEHKLFYLKRSVYLLLVASYVFMPLVWLLNRSTNFVENHIRKRGHRISVEELSQVLEISTGGNTSADERGILKGIVNFSTIAARQVMRSRMDITAFPVNLDFHELMDKINKTGYSRIPVYTETVDSIEGILYIKDVLSHIDKTEDFEWQSLIRPPYFIPENKKIDDLMREFQGRRVHMAIVVDEYGGTSGVVTLEDIIEEIVGDIHDEFDEEDKDFTQLDENTYIFESKTLINDFCRILEIDSEVFDEVRGGSESLGGLLLELFSRLPVVGEKTIFKNFAFTVISGDTKKIKRIKVSLQK
jgi:gliding motility-associated protein GldE